MITEKYEYFDLKRTDTNNTRYYNTKNGRAPSVTTILNITKSEESKAALEEWRKRKGAVIAEQITKEASSRGTRMHSYLEDWIKTDVLRSSGTHPQSKQSRQMAEQIINNALVNMNEFWGCEVNLHFDSIYAGTTDLVGVYKGMPCIVDFKQSNKLKKREYIDDYFYQLVSYAQAHDRMFGTNIKNGVVLMCTQDYCFQEFTLEGDEFDKFVNGWWHKVEDCFNKRPDLFV